MTSIFDAWRPGGDPQLEARALRADAAAVAERTSSGGETVSGALTMPPDSPLFARFTDDALVRDLAEQYLRQQVADSTAVVATLLDFARQDVFRTVGGADQLPGQLTGQLRQPDGTPARRLQVSLVVATMTAADGAAATAFTADDGTFALPVPTAMRVGDRSAMQLLVLGADGRTLIDHALDHLTPNGFLDPVTLPEVRDPLPLSVIAQLKDIAAQARGIDPEADHAMPAVTLGQDECEVVFRKDASRDRFPYGVLFRLTDPAPSQLTLTFDVPIELPDRHWLPAHYPLGPAQAMLQTLQNARLQLTPRVPIDRPISVDAFRRGLAGVERNVLGGTVPLAGSLAIGYVVRMAQRWTPTGLALGDLVYSLPLAPGEQQRIAVVERTATSTVVDTETLDTTEQLSFSERDDTSANATFSSAFREAASGGSSFDTEASSFSVAAAAGGGGVFPFGAFGGGVATSYGSSSASGNTATWMSGSRDNTSEAAQRTHASVQRQAAARRRSSRTAMRLATASETDTVVTKVITNHNKTRALTMQYWEVLRLFDVTTAVEGATLVCLVPFDVVRFLPVGQPATLDGVLGSRAEVLGRYGELVAHADVLPRVLPGRYRRGLDIVTDFAADPTATVQLPDAAEDVVSLSLNGTFLPFEDVSVTLMTKRGVRVGPVELSCPAPTGSRRAIPDAAGNAPSAFSTDEALFGELRSRRLGEGATFTGDLVLPQSVPRQDIAGFEIHRRMRRLDYRFVSAVVQELSVAKGLLGITDLVSALAAAEPRMSSVTKTFQPDRLEQELGGPRLSSFSAVIRDASGQVEATLASPNWSSRLIELARAPLPVPARVIPPALSLAALLEIEKTLQWCIRNTMTCSVALYASLTPEERTVLLERYSLDIPADPDLDRQASSVPLLSCVSNNVLGYYGNAMVLPFQIPVELTLRTSTFRDGKPGDDGLTTGQLQDAITRFHTDGFDPPRSTIALPTKGVLGEAVLGHCPAAEKIDLTRFWNWQDSPGDEATPIAAVTVPSGSLTAGLEAPSALPGMAPIITNFNTSPVAADTALASALAEAAAKTPGFDIGALTNAAGLTTLGGKTIDTAEAARKDALNSATQLASKAMDAAVSVYQAKHGATPATTSGSGGQSGSGAAGQSSHPGGGGQPQPGGGGGQPQPGGGGQPQPGGGGGQPQPGGGGGQPQPGGGGQPQPGGGGQPPGGGHVDVPALTVFFAHDSATIPDASPDGSVGDQPAAIAAFATRAQQLHASRFLLLGYASPEGEATHNATLARQRADALRDALLPLLPGATAASFVYGGGGALQGQPADYPTLRRAEARIIDFQG